MTARLLGAGVASATALALVTVLTIPTGRPGAEDAHHDEHAHEGHRDEHHDEHHEAPAFTVSDFEKAGVRLATAAPGRLDVGIELPGEVRPNPDRLAHIAPRFPGLVREVRKHVGDRVRAGDVLAVVESENLSTFELKAAFDGTVIDKHVAPGETVTREEAAFIVADLSTVWVNVSIYQSALPQVSVGQAVVVTSSHGGLEATGQVSYISPVVDQATRTASARVVLPNADGAWRPGLFVTATVTDSSTAPIVVPRRAIHTMDDRSVVFVADGDHFAVRPVRLGRAGRTRVEIVDGLAAGERFADERSFLVKAELGKGEAGHDH
jgi:cobalt-zinc-cadmium efflux system membrane fusion protein